MVVGVSKTIRINQPLPLGTFVSGGKLMTVIVSRARKWKWEHSAIVTPTEITCTCEHQRRAGNFGK
jgi:hypothetical protein